MFDASDLVWVDFEVASALDLKAVGTFRYATDASTRAIVLAYAIGDAPALAWHADGAILDWDNAPDDLRAAFDRGATFAAWNASFDTAVWNYATLGFPFLAPERVIDRDGPGRRLQPADRSRKRLARPRRRGQTERRQEADPAVLRRGRSAQRASRRMAALSRLCAPGRRGDARCLSPDATSAARGMAAVLGVRAHQSARRGRSTCRSFAALPPWRPRTPSPVAAGWSS